MTKLRKHTDIGEVPTSWNVSTLGSLCNEAGGCIQTGPFGSQLHANEYEADGVPVINPTHLEGDRINHSDVPRVSLDTARRLQRHRVEPGDILFGRRGEIGRHGLVSDAEAGWLCGTGCFLVRVRHPEVDNAFLSYLFSTVSVTEWLTAHAAGTIMPNLNNTVLSNLPVVLPAISEQRKIVELLGNLRRTVEIRSAVRDAFCTLKSGVSARLFREGLRGERLKQEEIGELPISWDVVSMESVVSIAEGQADPRRSPYRSMTHIGPENVEEGTGRLLPCKTAEDLGLISGKYIFKPNDIVYSKIRPYLKKAVVVDGEGLCSADMYPLSVRPGFDVHFTHALLLSDLFTNQAVSLQDRTGIPKLNRNQLNSIMVCRPSPDEQREIGEILRLLTARYELAVRQLELSRHLFSLTLHELMAGNLEYTTVPEMNNA